MAYQYKLLSASQRAEIISRVSSAPGQPVVTDDLRRAWEADLVAHQALLASTEGEEKARHAAAIAALETALGG